ncbi:hypothetical protein STRIP9103_07467 [Streptomyces ipomoeae 91-03]|uniref:Uncharacterized protein n=1 Tax=Streptomyces ipomoeae 91-03 TaxID=698759 RepID=L1L5E1_9ACTN|nr:hypothetical protein STRIP9103_07467 [Streptomyces ipomoeae 91-03]
MDGWSVSHVVRHRGTPPNLLTHRASGGSGGGPMGCPGAI